MHNGFVNINSEKMSKSLGNVVEPLDMAARAGLSGMRYFMLREMVFGADASFSDEALVGRYNADLANDLGNLLSRTVSMVGKYFGGTLPAERESSDADCDLKTMASTLRDRYEAEMEHFQFQNALEQVFNYATTTPATCATGCRRAGWRASAHRPRAGRRGRRWPRPNKRAPS